MGIPADYRDLDYKGKVPLLPKISMLPLSKEQLASQECVGGDAKIFEQAPIKLTHASGNACISRCSNALENACVYQCSAHTLTTDGPKKKVRFAVDVGVRAPPGKPQRAPIKIVDGCRWSPGVYQLLCLLGKTLEVAWVRALIGSSHF